MSLQDQIEQAGNQVFDTEPSVENLIKFLTLLKNNEALTNYLRSHNQYKFGKPLLGTQSSVDFTGHELQQTQVDETINWIEKWAPDIVLLDATHALDAQVLYALRLNGIALIAEADVRTVDGEVVKPELYSIDVYFDLGEFIVSGW
jgi:hypothetical protein